MCLFSSYLVYLITIFVGTFFYVKFVRKLKCLRGYVKESSSFQIFEVKNYSQCLQACNLLKTHCRELSVLGFDCEWVTRDGEQKLVPLLQLSSYRGLCCVFKVFEMSGILHPLKNLLQDKDILKVGDLSYKNSKLLFRNYNTQVQGALDLRYLYQINEDLATQSNKVVNLKLCNEWLVKSSNCKSLELTDTQRDYAAFVAIEIFKNWLCIICQTNFFSPDKLTNCQFSYKYNLTDIYKYIDINFVPKNGKDSNIKVTEESKKTILVKKTGKEIFVPRKSPLYDNYFMYAPDGELLCSCDKRKAQWYLDRGLAQIYSGKSNAIKLLFEPAGRAESDGGVYYQQLKENICVVCGASKSYLRHRVVPKEYRKHFPDFMKDHQSHDVVLMCIKCHYSASQHNYDLRQKLVTLCNAPLTESSVIHIKMVQKIKNYANALLKSRDNIPVERQNFIENEIRKFFKKETFTKDLLLEASNLQASTKNENYVSHGLKVVNYFAQKKDGLIQLEKLWREHFVIKMNPQYLPALWSVSHNHSKVEKNNVKNQLLDEIS